MRSRNQQCIDRILENETVEYSAKVRFLVHVDGTPCKGRLLCAETLIVLYRRTPMGLQTTLAWYHEIEHITSGKKKKGYYVQLLGEGSRILVLFQSKEARNTFHELCRSKMLP